MKPVSDIKIRPETAADIDAIDALTTAAFLPMPFSAGTEAPIIKALRKDGDLALSLVAEQDGILAAHIAFSPVRINGAADHWFGLGPVSVDPARQRMGIGSLMIREGLKRIIAHGAKGCVLIGNPAYYNRFDFVSGGLSYGSVPQEFVQWLAFDGTSPKGEIKYAPGFDAG